MQPFLYLSKKNVTAISAIMIGALVLYLVSCPDPPLAPEKKPSGWRVWFIKQCFLPDLATGMLSNYTQSVSVATIVTVRNAIICNSADKVLQLHVFTKSYH